jgi:hypothetical protein
MVLIVPNQATGDPPDLRPPAMAHSHELGLFQDEKSASNANKVAESLSVMASLYQNS